MPKFNWGISSDVIDSYDRSQQRFVPYSGPIPPNGVYAFVIKRLIYVASNSGKVKATLRIGLELKPRNTAEKAYASYFVMTFRPISDNNAFTYAPFLDAIGVSGTDFTSRTIGDADGNIQKIGRWRNDGKQVVLAKLTDKKDQEGNNRKDIDWFGCLTDYEEDVEDEDYDEDEELEDEELDEDDEDDEDYEPEPPKKRVATRKATPVRKAAPATRKRRKADDDIPF